MILSSDLDILDKILRIALGCYLFLAITTLHHFHPVTLALPLESFLVLLILLLGVVRFFHSDEVLQKRYLLSFLVSLPFIISPLISSFFNGDYLSILQDAEYKTMLKMLLVSPFLSFVLLKESSAKRFAQWLIVFFVLLGFVFCYRYIVLNEIRSFDARPLLQIRHGDPNFLATFFVMILPLTLYLCTINYQKKNKKLLILNSFCFLFLLFCVFLTQSRMAVVAGAISLGFLIFKKGLSWKWPASVISFLLMFYFLNSSFWDRFKNLFDKSNVDRIDSLKNGLSVFLDAPFFGAGMHKAQVTFYDHTGYPPFQSLEPALDVHHAFIKVLADLGFMGFLVYTLMFVVSFYQISNCKSQEAKFFLISSYLGLFFCLMVIGASYKDVIIFYLFFLAFFSLSFKAVSEAAPSYTEKL